MTLTFKDPNGVEWRVQLLAETKMGLLETQERTREATTADLLSALGQLSTGRDGPTREELSVLYHQSGRVSVSPHTSGFCPEVGFRALYAAGSASRQPEVDRLTAGIEGLTARLATVESERAAEVDRLTAENARLERAALGSEFNRDTERLRIDELSKELNEALQELRKRDDRG